MPAHRMKHFFVSQTSRRLCVSIKLRTRRRVRISPCSNGAERPAESSAEDTYTLDIEIGNRFVVGARTESRDLRVDRGQSHGSKNNHLQRHPSKNQTHLLDTKYVEKTIIFD